MNRLRDYTMARVDLGRAGNSVPVREMLHFQLAHARARDAVHFPLDARALCGELGGISVHSAARNRAEYLRRPDLGRRLAATDQEAVDRLRGAFDVVFVVADGLSALAVHRNVPELLREVRTRLNDERWRVAPVVIVEQGRVAIGDEIGERIGTAIAVVLIGERPGLSSPDSLGAYLTWGPRVGRTDAERNCISNIRREGLSPGSAAELLVLLLLAARAKQVSGIALHERLIR